jgi:hypothetical protein
MIGVMIATAILVIVLITTSGIYNNMTPIEHAAKMTLK